LEQHHGATSGPCEVSFFPNKSEGDSASTSPKAGRLLIKWDDYAHDTENI